MSNTETPGSEPVADLKVGKGGISALLMVMPLFFLSGASGLVFQNLWMRSLVITFGSSHFATSTVLAVFMGGLALGSFIAGRFVDRIKETRKLLGLYGLLEGLIGLYGLALPLLLALLHGFNVFVWTRWNPSFYTFSLLRFVVTAVFLLAPTTCMGATLPILSKYVCESRSELGKQAGTLYAVNTFGAVAGTFAGGFLLMPFLGMSITNYTACGINMALAAAAFLLMKISGERKGSCSHGFDRVDGAESARKPAVENGGFSGKAGAVRPFVSNGGEGALQAKLAVLGIAVSGGVDMVYQLAWTRTLSMILGSSVYAFTLILLCFLLGLAFGGGLYARRSATGPGQVANLSVIHIIIALASLVGLLLTDKLPPTFLVLMRMFRLHPTSAFVSKFVVSAALILVPTFFMGMIFPATVKVAAESGKDIGWTVGSVYALNTVGAIVGSFVGGFVLIPYLGIQLTISFMILVNVSLAIVFGGLNRTAGAAGKAARLFAAVAVAVGLAVFFTPWNLNVMISGVFRVSVYDVAGKDPGRHDPAEVYTGFRDSDEWKEWSGWALQNVKGLRGRATLREPLVGSELVFYKEGVVTTVSMTRTINEGFGGAYCWETLSLQINGKADASVTGKFKRPEGEDCRVLLEDPVAFGDPVGLSVDGDTETQVMSGLLGVFLSDPGRTMQHANIVGWGSGITAGSAAMTPIKEIEAVELEREVFRAARWFARYNHDADNHPKLRLIEGDGRTFLAASRKRYDLIVSEPSNPWITGCSNLFTAEYFKLVRDRLSDDGIFVQWLQIYEISPRNVKVILRTLSSVFPDVHVFRPGFGPADLLLAAGKKPIVPDYQRLQTWLETSGMGDEARRIGIRTPEDILIRSVLDSEGLREYVKGARLNTDDNALVEFSAPKDMINYYKFNPREIIESMKAHAQPISGIVRNAPVDFDVRMARAWVMAGFPQNALEFLEGKTDETALRIGRKAVLMLGSEFGPDTLRESVEGDLLAELERLYGFPRAEALEESLRSPVLRANRSFGFAVIGSFLSENLQWGDGLQFLWAAWESCEGDHCSGIGRLLLGWTMRAGLSELGWEVARKLEKQLPGG